jgi:predicted DNA-binding protein
MPIERLRLFNLRVSEEERAKLRALADHEGTRSSSLVRRWIQQHYEARFGDVAPKKVASR